MPIHRLDVLAHRYEVGYWILSTAEFVMDAMLCWVFAVVILRVVVMTGLWSGWVGWRFGGGVGFAVARFEACTSPFFLFLNTHYSYTASESYELSQP